MLGTKVIATGVVDANPTTGVEMDVTPNLPGTKAMIMVTLITAPTLTPVIEGSDDNSSWSTLHAFAAVNITDAYLLLMSPEIVLPKYVRVNNSAYTDGTMDAYILNAN